MDISSQSSPKFHFQKTVRSTFLPVHYMQQIPSLIYFSARALYATDTVSSGASRHTGFFKQNFLKLVGQCVSKISAHFLQAITSALNFPTCVSLSRRLAELKETLKDDAIAATPSLSLLINNRVYLIFHQTDFHNF